MLSLRVTIRTYFSITCNGSLHLRSCLLTLQYYSFTTTINLDYVTKHHIKTSPNGKLFLICTTHTYMALEVIPINPYIISYILWQYIQYIHTKGYTKCHFHCKRQTKRSDYQWIVYQVHVKPFSFTNLLDNKAKIGHMCSCHELKF